MAPVARKLAAARGVLEPLQGETSVDGQVRELHALMRSSGDPPVTLIGHSWGAWLSYITASRHPCSVDKLILVGSGPFEERYAASILPTRLARLGEEERADILRLMDAFVDPAVTDKDMLLARFGELLAAADSFDPLPHANEVLEARYEVNQSVWAEAAELRRSGRLLEMGRGIRCPVVAIHGDHDPHPAEGVSTPLSRVLEDFRFVLLDRCGHTPWIERFARDRFYSLLHSEAS